MTPLVDLQARQEVVQVQGGQAVRHAGGDAARVVLVLAPDPAESQAILVPACPSGIPAGVTSAVKVSIHKLDLCCFMMVPSMWKQHEDPKTP